MTWNVLTTQEDADALMRTFGGFHDACIHEFHVRTGYSVRSDLSMTCPGKLDTSLRILVQRQSLAPSAIELFFEQVTRLNVIAPPENCDEIIYGATLCMQQAEWYWSPSEAWSPASPDRDAETWVSARRLSWRDASAWMGDDLRYGARDATDV